MINKPVIIDDPAPATPTPAAGEGKRGPDGHLGYLLRQAAAAHRRRMERSLEDLGVTYPQFVVLLMVAAYPGASGADLARLALLTPQTVTVIANNLERSGAIMRGKHPVHGRILPWTITPAGAVLLESCRERAATVEQTMAALIPDGLEPALRAWLVDVALE